MRTVVYFLLLGTILSACGHNNQYRIRGSFTGQVDEEWVYMVRFMESDPRVDSARIKNNEFTFEGFADIVEVYGLSYHPDRASEVAPFFLEPGKIEIVVDPNDWFTGTEVRGGKINNEYNVIELMGLSQEDAVEYIKNNPMSPGSVFLLAMVYRSIETHKVGDLLGYFPEKMHQAAIYEEAYSYYQTQLALEEQMPSFRYKAHAEEMDVEFGGESVIADLAELNDGKPVYLKIWGTWCAPCRAEFPSIRDIETHFREKDLEFAYICIQSPEEEWREMVTSEELRGQHFLFSNELTAKLAAEVNLRTVPRYLLIDSEGNIIDYNAPKPSDEKLSALLDDLIH